MKSIPLIIAAILGFPFCAAASGADAPPDAAKPVLEIWAVDPLIKVFPDDPPRTDAPALAEVARGEHATLQVEHAHDGLLQIENSQQRSAAAATGPATGRGPKR